MCVNRIYLICLYTYFYNRLNYLPFENAMITLTQIVIVLPVDVKHANVNNRTVF